DRRRRRCDDDPCGPHDALAQLVALLDDVDHGALLRLGGLGEQRLVHVRIELSLGLDRRDAVALEHPRERAVDEADALLELRLLVVVVRFGRALRPCARSPVWCSSPAAGARSRSSRIGMSSTISRSFASWTYSCRSRAA